jgi:hypothetical protein
VETTYPWRTHDVCDAVWSQGRWSGLGLRVIPVDVDEVSKDWCVCSTVGEVF